VLRGPGSRVTRRQRGLRWARASHGRSPTGNRLPHQEPSPRHLRQRRRRTVCVWVIRRVIQSPRLARRPPGVSGRHRRRARRAPRHRARHLTPRDESAPRSTGAVCSSSPRVAQSMSGFARVVLKMPGETLNPCPVSKRVGLALALFGWPPARIAIAGRLGLDNADLARSNPRAPRPNMQDRARAGPDREGRVGGPRRLGHHPGTTPVIYGSPKRAG
jgi:hypothetical protein